MTLVRNLRDLKALIESAESKTAASDHEDEIGVGEYAQTTDDTGRFWGNAGAGLLFVAEDTGRVLIPFRSSEVNEPHTWGVWGGAIDPEEAPSGAALREAREEAGYTGPMKLQRAYVYENGDFKYTTFVGFVPSEFDPKLNWETERFEWFKPGEWPQPLHFGLRAALPHVEAILKRVGKMAAGDTWARRWYDAAKKALGSFDHKQQLSDYYAVNPKMDKVLTSVVKPLIDEVIRTAPEWMKLIQDPSSKIFAFNEPGHGSSETYLSHGSRNKFHWMLDFNPTVDDMEEFLGTLYHELLHVEQALKIVLSKDQVFYKNLRPGIYNCFWKPFGQESGDDGGAKQKFRSEKEQYLTHPAEIEAHAYEFAKNVWALIRRKFPQDQWAKAVEDAAGSKFWNYLDMGPKSNDFMNLAPEFRKKYMKKFGERLQRYLQDDTSKK